MLFCSSGLVDDLLANMQQLKHRRRAVPGKLYGVQVVAELRLAAQMPLMACSTSCDAC